MGTRFCHLYFLLCVAYRMSVQIQKESFNCIEEEYAVHGHIPCEVFLNSSPICLICPIKPSGYAGLSWTHSYNARNDTIFIDNVRIQGSVDTYAVNMCGVDDYTLTVSPSKLSDGGSYICSLGRSVVASFDLTIIKAVPELFLRCKVPKKDCDSSLRPNVTLIFECQVLNTRGPFVISWSLDESIVYSSEYAEGIPSLVHTLIHTYKGTERSLSCEVNGPNVRAVRKIFKFKPAKNKVYPVLSIYWNGTRNETPIPFKKMETISLTCEASNILPPIVLSLEVNGEKMASQNIQSAENISMDDQTQRYNITPNFDKNNFIVTLQKSYSISINFTPTEWSPMISCVCDGPFVFRSEISVPFVLIRATNQSDQTTSHVEKQTPQRTVFLSVALVLVGIIILTVLVVFITVQKIRIAHTPVTVAHNSYSLNRCSSIPEHQNSDSYELTEAKRSSQACDIYYENDVSGGLSSFVRLVKKISNHGRLQRWIGELSGLAYDKGKCVASTNKDDATENDISQFKLLAMGLKDNVRHDNVVHVIGIEAKQVPYFIYTEFVEMGNLRDFLIKQQQQNIDPDAYVEELLRFAREVSSALIYLKSIQLCHPGICCEKVLLTEQHTCKVYDIQIYPVSEDILEYLVVKNDKFSSSRWTLAPETRLKKKHTYQSDSWSLAVLLCRIYSFGMDPFKPDSKKNYDTPSNWSSGCFTRPHLCPESLYSVMKSAWKKQSTQRPTIEEIHKFLSDLINDEVYSLYRNSPKDSEIYYDNIRKSSFDVQ